MKEQNVILDKTYKFGLGISKLYLFLRKKKFDIGLCSQLLNTGTSIEANAEEGIGGSSRKDFISKLQISYREDRETRYWLRLLRDGDIIDKKLSESFLKRLRRNINNSHSNLKLFKRTEYLIFNY